MIGEILLDPHRTYTRFATVGIECATVFMPDSFIPEAHAPLDFVVALQADHVTWLSPVSRAFVAVDLDARAAIALAARAAITSPRIGPGVDTAIGRYITTVSLRVEAPHSTPALATASRSINHAAYQRPTGAWAELLTAIAQVVHARIADEDRAKLDFLGAALPSRTGSYR